MRHLLLISMLAARVGWAHAAAAANPARYESDFVGFSFAPARLVFDDRDLAQCLADATAQRCVLRGEGMAALRWHRHPCTNSACRAQHGTAGLYIGSVQYMFGFDECFWVSSFASSVVVYA